MTKLNFAISQSLFQRYQDFWIRYYFKYELPKITETTFEGVNLDLSRLSLKVRNRILNVGYEDEERRMCREYLTRDDAVLELGGAIGFIGIFCQKILGIRDYVTVEANPMTIEILKRNYDLNGLQPNVWNVAVGQDEGCVELNVGGDFWENFIVHSPERTKVNTIQVPSSRLETLLRRVPFAVTTLIVDIEGAEQFIQWRELPESIRKIIIEIHPGVLGQELAYNLISEIISRGFRVAREDGHTFAFLRK
jgi:FkbM family methyltransferase